MKISNLSTDAALDVLVELTPYVTAILSDKEFRDELKSKIDKKGELTSGELIAVGVSRVNAIIPVVMKKHREDVYGIISVLNGTTVEEISKQNFIKTALQVKEAFSDKELLDFFKSFGDMGKKQ